MCAECAKRREFVRGRIAKIPGVSCSEIAGAFYAFINIKKHLGRSYNVVKIDNSSQWCLGLLDKKGVATVMGSAFGAEGYATLRDYLAYTRASHLDLVHLAPEPGKLPLVVPSFRAAEQQLGPAMLREVVAEAAVDLIEEFVS